MITTATEIKHVENSFEVLNELELKIELADILIEEFKQDLTSDIVCYF
ncbi:MAG: hypothetical protein ACFB4I_09220 [Cyanophyceae cyanobacterium]